VSQYSLSLFDYTTAGVIPRLAEDYTAGKFVSGVAKVMQDFHAELMTIRGTVRFDPYYGCNLMSAIGISSLRSLQDVESLVSSAAMTIVANMRSRYSGNEPADAQIASAQLINCQQHLDAAEVQIELTTAAGESAILNLPVRFIPEENHG